MKILNIEDCIMVDLEDIKSIGVKEIVVDHTGNTAYAIVAYPGPGAGYVLARYNNIEDAKAKFEQLMMSLQLMDESLLLASKFEQPAPKEPEQLKLNIGQEIKDKQ